MTCWHRVRVLKEREKERGEKGKRRERQGEEGRLAWVNSGAATAMPLPLPMQWMGWPALARAQMELEYLRSAPREKGRSFER